VGALLRREGLYYSHLAKWRGEREAGMLANRPGRAETNPDWAQVERLARENAALKRKLEQAESIMTLKKLAGLVLRPQFGTPQPAFISANLTLVCHTVKAS
jgi:transposase-like protein